MITPDHPRIMSRYNRWQNRSLAAAAGTLTDEERWRDRGAFFGAIAATLNHIYWDDRIWFARVSDAPGGDAIPHAHPYTDAPRDWATYLRDRAALDDEIVAWADGLAPGDLDGVVHWDRGGVPMATPRTFCVVHMFNHQTHHRGQVHAMLTMAGASPEPTDLPVMPDDAPPVASPERLG